MLTLRYLRAASARKIPGGDGLRPWPLPFCFIIASLVGGLAPSTCCGIGPQNVVLVVNPDDPDSLAVANCYVELRQILPANVVYIPWQLDARAATGLQFRERLLKPLLAEIKKRGLNPQIDCVAFSSGFPYLIDCARLFPGKEFPREARPTTSLTSAAYLYQFLLNDRPELFAMNANLYFAPTIEGRTESLAFSASKLWGPNGQPVAADGMAYLLATALGVTHGHGNKAAEIIASLERAKKADGTKPAGTIYYMKNGNDPRSRARDTTFAAATAELAAVGVTAVVEDGVVPRDKSNVAGLTTGAAHVPFRNSGSTLLPGALVDNLTSAGGQMLLRPEVNPQTRISEYMRLGAAGASGAVVEPFAIWQKFPTAALHVHYARGCSLAEAFYRSIAAPGHLLVIGDPLCRPWAVPPEVSVAGIPEGGIFSGEVVLTPTARFSDGRHASRLELFIDGLRTQSITPGGGMTVATSGLADGWHELRVVAVDDTAVAVEGFWSRDMLVHNGTNSLQLKIATPRVPLSGTVAIEVASTAATAVKVMQNGREVATSPNGSGHVLIDAKLLGKGRVRVIGEQAGTPSVRSRPVAVEVF